MRILRLITSTDPRHGGPIEGVRRVATVWAQQGHSQDILSLDPAGSRFLPDYPGKIFELGPRHGSSLTERYRYSNKVVPWLKLHASEYDAIIVSGLWRYLSRAAIQGLKASDVPYFVFPHGMLDPWFAKGNRVKHLVKQLSWLWAEGPLLNRASAVLFTSEEERLAAKDAFWPYSPNEKVVNYGAARIEGDSREQQLSFETILPNIRGKAYLLYLSRIHPKKGCDLLIDAFLSEVAPKTHLHLVIAGPDNDQLAAQLQERVSQTAYVNRVHFPGMLAGNAKAGAFRGAEAFILPSHQENFGIVVAESLSSGTPVLISDKVNIWREIQADGAGLVAPDTLEGTKRLLRTFLQLSSTEKVEMRAAALTCYANRFDITRAAESLIDTISDALTNPVSHRVGPHTH